MGMVTVGETTPQANQRFIGMLREDTLGMERTRSV
jgi:hypothetical protein